MQRSGVVTHGTKPTLLGNQHTNDSNLKHGYDTKHQSQYPVYFFRFFSFEIFCKKKRECVENPYIVTHVRVRSSIQNSESDTLYWGPCTVLKLETCQAVSNGSRQCSFTFVPRFVCLFCWDTLHGENLRFLRSFCMIKSTSPQYLFQFQMVRVCAYLDKVGFVVDSFVNACSFFVADPCAIYS